MAKPVFFRVAVNVPLRRLYDYLPPPDWTPPLPLPGVRVKVPFGHKNITAVLVATHDNKPDFKLKRVEAILDKQPLLDAQLMELLLWASRYYCHPLGEVIAAALPPNLRNGKAATRRHPQVWRALPAGDSAVLPNNAPKQRAVYDYIAARPQGCDEPSLSAVFEVWRPTIRTLCQKGLIEAFHRQTGNGPPLMRSPGYDLTEQQHSAVEQVRHSLNHYQSFLLHGVTGSGKTEVYLHLTQAVLAQNKQVLILVPEIGLTPQLLTHFKERLHAPIALLHSGLSHGARQDAWLAAQHGEARIIIGTRSAIFTPAPSIGLIIVDEEHDSSFKQMDGFRYSARDLAIKRASLLNIPVVLGSATPSLESFRNIKSHKFRKLCLPERTGAASLPSVYRIDMKGRVADHGLAERALRAIEDEIGSGGQVLIFLNRRGFAPTLICADCGWMSLCHHCDVRMTVHRAAGRIRCHVCSHEAMLPGACPECNSEKLISLGQGTERLEIFLSSRFPEAGVVRVDRDATRKKGALQDIIRSIRSGENKILVGTQMLAKGHHFPQVGTVIIMDADSGLYGLDFHAQERMAQLITQVSGRAGRATRHGKVYIQTYHPEHPFFENLEQKPYEIFVKDLLKERAVTGMPPYSHLVLLRVQAGEMLYVEKFIEQAARQGASLQDNTIELLGPAIAPLERKAGKYHMQLIIKSSHRRSLHHFLDQWISTLDTIKDVRRVRWSVDVDPYDLY